MRLDLAYILEKFTQGDSDARMVILYALTLLEDETLDSFTKRCGSIGLEHLTPFRSDL